MARDEYYWNGGQQTRELSKNSSTSKSKRSKQENTHVDKIKTNLDPVNKKKTKKKRNLKMRQICLKKNFQNTSQH